MDFAGKRILITGASAGIGLELARALGRRGARLGLLARDPARLAAAAKSIEASTGAETTVHGADVRDREAIGRAVDACAEGMGGLDGVIANSGLCLPGLFHETPAEDVAVQLETNLLGTVHTLHRAWPHLLDSRGFAAVTASPAGEGGIYGFAAYGASKAGVIRLMDSLRQEYGRHGLRCHVLLPPDTDTPGYQHETTRYPPETRAILSGGRVHGAAAVAEELVRGLARGQYRITVGFETKLFLRVAQVCPALWQWYCQRQIRSVEQGKT